MNSIGFRELNLSNSMIDIAAMQELAIAIRRTDTLRALRVAQSKMTDDVADVLQAALAENMSIIVLDLAQNYLHVDTVEDTMVMESGSESRKCTIDVYILSCQSSPLMSLTLSTPIYALYTFSDAVNNNF